MRALLRWLQQLALPARPRPSFQTCLDRALVERDDVTVTIRVAALQRALALAAEASETTLPQDK